MQKIKNFFIDIWSGVTDFVRGLFGKGSPDRVYERRSSDPSYGLDGDDDGGDDSGNTIVFKNSESDKLKELAKTKAVQHTDKDPVIPVSQLRGRGKSFTSSFKKNDSKPLFALGIIITTAKLFIVAVVIFGIACLGAVLGIANAYLGTTPELDLDQIRKNDLTSYIFDRSGNLITSYAGMENRDYATLDEIPVLMQKAVIDIEDVRFYYHKGVDIKRLFGAFVSNVTSSGTSGGSTLTQQLIKNQLLTSERSYKRKIQEASLAIQLEKKYSKEQILESYLNTIPMGGLNYGIKTAAKDYFGKELDELTLREMACLAGITQFPYGYNPRRVYYTDDPELRAQRIENLNKRINLVLEAMYEAGDITLAERDDAMNDTFDVIEVSSVNEMYSCAHFVEYAIEDVIDAFIEMRNLENTTYNRQAVENELRTQGYNIYTTVDPDIQSTMQEAMTFYAYPALADSADSVTAEGIVQPQSAAVIIEQSTGQIIAMAGSRTAPTIKKTLNRATSDSTQIGSSIKPLAVYGPALDGGLGLGTTIENIKVPITGWDTEKGYPTTSHTNRRIKYGPVSIKNGIKYSLNIVAGRTLMDHVGVDKAYSYLIDLGINEEKLNKDPVGMTLGSSGISPLDTAAAYAAIANGGTYIEPIAFTHVDDRYGNSLLEASDVQESHEVYKRSTAYMLVSALTQAVEGGTGTNAKIDGITVAGKTGTNAKNRGVFFAGMTGYYTSTVWIGHDYFKQLSDTSGGNGAAPLWQTYMSKILEGKEDKPILEGSAADYGVTEIEVCSVSGMLATDACRADTLHAPVKEYFAADSIPEECTMHTAYCLCPVTGMLATGYCPVDPANAGSIVTLSPDSLYLKLEPGDALAIFPSILIASGVTEDAETGEITETASELVTLDPATGAISSTTPHLCTMHTADWQANNELVAAALLTAQDALNNYETFVAEYELLLSDADKYNLLTYANALRAVMSSSDAAAITNSATALNNVVLAAQDAVAGIVPDF